MAARDGPVGLRRHRVALPDEAVWAGPGPAPEDEPDTQPGLGWREAQHPAPRGTDRAATPADPGAERAVREVVTRAFFVTAAVAAATAAALTGWQAAGRWDDGAVVPLLGLQVAMVVLCLVGLRLGGRHLGPMMAAVMGCGGLAVAAAAALFGWGLRAPGLAFFALFACLLGAVASRASAVAMALFGLAVVGAFWATAPAADGGPAGTVLQAGALALQIAAGLAAGLLISRVLSRHVHAAAERERRFGGLLRIAADAYWEIGPDHRLLATPRATGGPWSVPPELVGSVPWERPEFDCDADVLDALLADVEARVRFRDRPLRWRARGRPARHLLVSGEPRHDLAGRFLGYWGVARDVTGDVRARATLQAVEHRYQELFGRIPTPLVVHRSGVVVDANPAALLLLGHATVDGLLGQDLLACFESGDSRERARRGLEAIEAREPGDALPVADFRLVGRGGRRLAVRAAAVRIVVDEEPATLSIFVDDTERRAAEDAVRRSEAMLSHLVASSPDAITLTELATGRYAMVNQTFERLTGWPAAEVIGRTAAEIGIWPEDADRERFVARLQERGVVNDLPTTFVTRDRRPAHMLVSGARFRMDQREYLVINARDVTAVERARLEREAIVDNASIGIAVTREGRFVLANPFFEQLHGWPPGSLVGQPARIVWGSADEHAALVEALGPALERGERVEAEREARRRDDSRFVARVIARAVDPAHPACGGTVWLVEDVTQRRQVEQALARARDAAEAASRAKSDFLANTSHELRTPLNGLIGLARLARTPGVEEERRQRYLEQLELSAQSLAAIISDILDFSKIEAGRLQIEASDFDLGALLRALREAWAPQAASAGLLLGLELGAGVGGPVRGDPLRLRQILENFLGNAVKFTGRGEVRLHAWRTDGERVRFEVRDTGPGIDEATQQRLFRPFTQADASTTRRFGGTGLGLSICRELATHMGGAVGLSSQPGQGSCFWVELPLPPARLPESLRPGAHGEHEQALAASADAQLRGARVLVVEDNPVNMLIVVALLEQWGLAVEQTSDGEQALAAVDRARATGRPFDAVLMDVQMPVMSGHEAARRLRQRHPADQLPVIALTAAALVGEREQALQAGMNDFLTKPIDPERLRQTLRRWLPRPRTGG